MATLAVTSVLPNSPIIHAVLWIVLRINSAPACNSTSCHRMPGYERYRGRRPTRHAEPGSAFRERITCAQ